MEQAARAPAIVETAAAVVVPAETVAVVATVADVTSTSSSEVKFIVVPRLPFTSVS